MTNLYTATRTDGSTITFHAENLNYAKRYCLTYLFFIPAKLELAN
jgi:hypothetical protein